MQTTIGTRVKVAARLAASMPDSAFAAEVNGTIVEGPCAGTPSFVTVLWDTRTHPAREQIVCLEPSASPIPEARRGMVFRYGVRVA